MVTPFFPSNKCYVGSYIFDQLNEIRKQSNLEIELVKIVSIFSNEKDYIFKVVWLSIGHVNTVVVVTRPGLKNN